MYYTTHGIILKKTDVGEADALFTLYTKEFGKIRAKAQGVKKEEAKLKGHLEPLNFSLISFVVGKNGERLTHAILCEPWHGIRANLEKLKTAVRMASYVDEQCFNGEKDEGVWQTLMAHFMLLEKTPEIENDFLNSFEVEIQKCLGYHEADTDSHIRRFA